MLNMTLSDTMSYHKFFHYNDDEKLGRERDRYVVEFEYHDHRLLNMTTMVTIQLIDIQVIMLRL